MRDAVKPIAFFIHRIKVEPVRIELPAFCPHCGADLRGEQYGPVTEPDGHAPGDQWPVTLWITTVGTQSARVGRPLVAAGSAPVLDRFQGLFDPGDHPVFTTGADCGACLQTLITARGLCSPGDNSIGKIEGVE